MQLVHIYVEKMEDYEGDLCIHSFHLYRNIYAVLGNVLPYASAISGAVAIVCALFSPLLDVLHGCLHFLIRLSDCLSWYCELK